jgi:hypothetical protein
MAFLKTYVTDSNDAILNEVGRTTVVSLVGSRHRPGVASRHNFGTPPRRPVGQRHSGVWIGMTSRDLQLSSHKGQWRLMTGASQAAA